MSRYKLFCLSLAALSILGFNYFSYNSSVAADVTKPVSPIEVVNCPSKYLNKNITFDAEFVSFSALGLDYKPAFRESTKYIGVLINRSDSVNHVIPLSEMKIFLARDMAEKNIELEAGDKIRISGTVFSTALGDPWVDVKSFTVLTKKESKK